MKTDMKTVLTAEAATVCNTERTGAGIGQESLTDPARFDIECRGTVCILHVTGEVDVFNSPALDAGISEISRAHRGAVIVSFLDCGIADCSALGVLVRQFERLNARLSIIAPPSNGLRYILDITSLTTLLPVYDSLREASLAISADQSSLGDLATWNAPDWNRAPPLPDVSPFNVVERIG